MIRLHTIADKRKELSPEWPVISSECRTYNPHPWTDKADTELLVQTVTHHVIC